MTSTNIQTSLIQSIRENSRPLAPEPTRVNPQLPRLDNIAAVLFDIYGTLLISASGDVGTAMAMDNTAALEAALRKTNLSANPGAAAARGAELLLDSIHTTHAKLRKNGIEHPEIDIRTTWEDVFARLAGEELITSVPDAETRLRFAVEYESRVNPVWPMPGAAETLAALRNNNIHLGIVSNAQFFTPLLFDALLEKSVAELGFDKQLCSWSFQQLEAKPSTNIFRKPLRTLREKWGIEANSVLFIGNDMRNDIAPAAACGCRTALFAGDARSLRLRVGELGNTASDPDAILTRLTQLTKILCGAK